MKKLCHLFIMLTGFTTLYSQTTTPRTIFEVLKKLNKTCPIESYPRREDIDDDKQYSSWGKMDSIHAEDKLLATRDRIAKHFTDVYINPDKPYVLYRFWEIIYEPFSNSLPKAIPKGSLVKDGDYYILQTKDNKVIWEKKLSYVERPDPNGFNTFKYSNLSTYYDYTGKIISSGEYEYIIHNKGDYYQVLKNQKWGIINSSGKLIVPPVYDYIS